MTGNGLQTNGATRHDGEHLTDEQLSRYVDSDLTPEERRAADRHLSVCDACAARLADFFAISSLLQTLPVPAAPRSFQLDSSLARQRLPLWQRLGAALLPALPAMRAGTIALALAFASVTAYRVVDDGASVRPTAEDNAGQIMATNTMPVGSTAIAPAEGGEGDSVGPATETAAAVLAPNDAADGSDQSQGRVQPTSRDSDLSQSTEQAPPTDDAAGQTADSPGEAADSAPAADTAAEEESITMAEAEATPESASIEMAALAPEASPTATATESPSATPTATATPIVPTPSPTMTPAPAADDTADDSSWTGWAQLVLGVLLALLGGLVVGVHRLKGKVSG